jgi:pyruvate dehydrogenase E1 component alpha subunit
VLAVMAATRVALERARRGDGPTFIEAVTYRMGPHTTADDPKRYRSDAELEQWRRRDPIARLEAHLRAAGELSQEHLDAVQAQADEMAREMRAACLGMVTRPAMAVFDRVYAEPHSGLERERDEYAAYLATFEEA